MKSSSNTRGHESNTPDGLDRAAAAAPARRIEGETSDSLISVSGLSRPAALPVSFLSVKYITPPGEAPYSASFRIGAARSDAARVHGDGEGERIGKETRACLKRLQPERSGAAPPCAPRARRKGRLFGLEAAPDGKKPRTRRGDYADNPHNFSRNTRISPRRPAGGPSGGFQICP